MNITINYFIKFTGLWISIVAHIIFIIFIKTHRYWREPIFKILLSFPQPALGDKILSMFSYKCFLKFRKYKREVAIFLKLPFINSKWSHFKIITIVNTIVKLRSLNLSFSFLQTAGKSVININSPRWST